MGSAVVSTAPADGSAALALTHQMVNGICCTNCSARRRTERPGRSRFPFPTASLQLRRSRRFALLHRRSFGTFDLWRRNVCRPGHARLRLEIALLDNRRRGRDDDEMVAAGALDLSAGKLG